VKTRQFLYNISSMIRKTSKIQVILLILISGLVGYYIGVNKVNFDWKGYKPQVNVESKSPPPEISNVDFAKFWTVWQKLEANYYDKSKLDPQKMLDGAISGMVSSLGDPFTVYLPPVQNENFKAGMAGQFQGIGAELGMKENQIIVISPLTGSPAQKAGVRAGDAILAVDGTSVSNWSISQAVEKIRGPKGTPVTLTLRQDEENPREVEIVRDVITVNSVEAYIKKAKDVERVKISGADGEESIAYVRLSQFGDNTNKDWLEAINNLSIELRKNGDVKGIVFDLRNNPGGYLTDAVFIAAEFLEEGKTVVIEEENNEQQVLNVNRKGLLLDIPVIVLVNKGSASASEIVAGALRDHERANLLGETTFGKGTIQQAEDLGNGAGVHITIAKWLTPNEIWVHDKGLKPDIEVELNPDEPDRDFQLERAIQELLK
jgi:carboxyl-terminal processing protease